MHGGSVLAESEGKGRGATFTVTLPLMGVSDLLAEFEFQQPDQAENVLRTVSTPKCAEVARLDGLHVLVVDDHADTRELLRVTLTNFGADVNTCASSADALASVKS